MTRPTGAFTALLLSWTLAAAGSIGAATALAASNENCAHCGIGVPTSEPPSSWDKFQALADPSCRRQVAKEIASMTYLYAGATERDLKNIPRTIDGIRLIGSPQELDTFQEVLGAVPPSSWKQSVLACGRPATVDCALTAILQTPGTSFQEARLATYKVLLLARQTGYTISLSQEVNAPGVQQLWSPQEIDHITDAVYKLPKSFHRPAVPSLRYFFRLADGYKLGNRKVMAMALAFPGTWANGRTVLPGNISFAPGGFPPRTPPEETVIHEITHHYDFSTLVAGGRDYVNATSGFAGLSGWESTPDPDKPGGKRWTHARNACFVTDYAGSENPLEDLSDSIAYYVEHPEILLHRCPEKYDFIKHNFFDGREYFPDRWPALDAAIAANGGLPRLIESCMNEITEVNTFVRDGAFEASFAEAIDSDKRSTQLHPLSKAPSILRCMTKTAKLLAEKLASTPDYCSEGGLAEVQTRLRKAVAPAMDEWFQLVASYLKDPRAQVGCTGWDIVKSECFLRHLQQNLRPQSVLRKQLSPADLRRLGSRAYEWVPKPVIFRR